MDDLNFSGNMMFEKVKGKKKTAKNFSWKGSVKGNKKTKSAHILLDANLDKEKIGIDVNVSANQNSTVNVEGEIRKNGRTAKVNVKDLNIRSKSEIKESMQKVMMSLM